MKVNELIEKLKNKDGESKLCCLIWSQEDVLGLAEDRNIKITDSEADEILDTMERRHDASYGITWDTISSYLDELNDG